MDQERTGSPKGQEEEVPRNHQNIIRRIGWFHDNKLYIADDWETISAEAPIPPPDDDMAIIRSEENGRRRLLIRSPFIMSIFKMVATKFPGAAFDDAGIILEDPFASLYFYLDDMRKLAKDSDAPSASQDDLAALVHHYDSNIRPSHEKIAKRLKDGVVGFHDLWALFRPGDILLSKEDFGQTQLYRICTSTFRRGGEDLLGDDNNDDKMWQGTWMGSFMGSNKPTRFCFDAWCIRWNSPTRTFTRAQKTFRINMFHGLRAVTTLQQYPLKYTSQAEIIHHDMVERGRLWKQLISGIPVPKMYRGPAMELEKGFTGITRSEPSNLNDRIIVDHDGSSGFEDPKSQYTIKMPNMSEMMEPVLNMISMFNTEKKEPPVQPGNFDEAYEHFDDFPASGDFEDLQALLSPSTINCFSLTLRKWFAISVSKANLRDIEWKREAFEHLVLDDNIKQTIIKLVEQHRSQEQAQIVGDVIHGKGNGLVVVLHGPPGVGKTLTAESVAEYTRRPLYSINIGEVTSEVQVRSRLQQIFNEATRWNAVLLLDEADVVLEKRSFEDIRRNGTVSVFLRMLEYYEGILFLTTNRLKHIDDAFQSRIHLAFQYREHNRASRGLIWQRFIDHLPNTEEIAKQELSDNLEELQGIVLNGRQIRNIIFIAQSLARGESGSKPGSLRYRHVQEAVKTTQKFLEYFQEDVNFTKGQIASIGGRGTDWIEPKR